MIINYGVDELDVSGIDYISHHPLWCVTIDPERGAKLDRVFCDWFPEVHDSCPMPVGWLFIPHGNHPVDLATFVLRHNVNWSPGKYSARFEPRCRSKF